jgi:hypothetical protein
MTLRRREVTEILKTKHSIALCGVLALEEDVGLSEDRLQDELMNERKNE